MTELVKLIGPTWSYVVSAQPIGPTTPYVVSAQPMEPTAPNLAYVG